MFAQRHSEGREQYDAVLGAVRASPALIALGQDGRGEDRFTSRDMIETEQRLSRAAEIKAVREPHRVSEGDQPGATVSTAARGSFLLAGHTAAYPHLKQRHHTGIFVVLS